MVDTDHRQCFLEQLLFYKFLLILLSIAVVQVFAKGEYYSQKLFTLLSLPSELQSLDYLVRATFGKTTVTIYSENRGRYWQVSIQKVCQRILYFISSIYDPIVFICIEQSSWTQAEFQTHTDANVCSIASTSSFQGLPVLGSFHAPSSQHILFIPLTFLFFLKLFFHLNLQLPIESICEQSVDETSMRNAFSITSLRCLMSTHHLPPLMFHRFVQISLFPENCSLSFFQKTPCYPECNTQKKPSFLFCFSAAFFKLNLYILISQ